MSAAPSLLVPTPTAEPAAAFADRPNSLPSRRVGGWIISTWPVLLLVIHLVSTRGTATAPWMMGWLAALVTCCVGGYALFVAEGFDLQRLELGAVFAAAYPVFVMSGVPQMMEEHFGTDGARRLPLATVVAYVGVLAGVRVVTMMGRGRRFRPLPRTSALQRLFVIGALAAGLGLLALYLSFAGTPPLARVLTGARGTELARARQNAVVNLSNPLVKYGFNFARLYVLPVAGAALLVNWTRVRTMASALLAAVVLLIALLAAALTLEKSPVMRLVVMVGLTLALGAGFRVRMRWLVAAVLAAAVFPIVVLSASNPEASITTVLRLFTDRIFIDPARVVYFYLDWAPRFSGGFLGGRLIPFIGGRAGPTVPVTEIISSRIFPDATVQGNANVAFVGNYWVDFGWWGVAIGSVFTGIVLAGIQRVLDIVRTSAFGLATTALLATQTALLTLTGVFDAVLSIGMGVVDIIVFAYVWVRLLSPNRVRTTVGRGTG